jgi:nucleotide-binding universal stress UspA family protein
MTPIKTILCPTDFSASSRAALDVALALAKVLGARLHLVHVQQLPYIGFDDSMGMASMSVELLTQLRVRADQQLEAQLELCRAAQVEADVEQVDGVPHHRIVELAEGADLVVMGTHGRTGLPRLMIGSVAERVIRLAKCPVLTVPTPETTKA